MATAGHAVCALLAAWRASSTPGMNAGVAALKGFFFGALGVNEVFSSAEAGDQLRRMEK